MNISTILLGLDRFEEFATVKSVTALKNIVPYLFATLSPDTDLKLLYEAIEDKKKEDSVIPYFLPYIDFYTLLLYWGEINAPQQVDDLLKLEKSPAVLDTVRSKLKVIDVMFKTSLSQKLKERIKSIRNFLKTKNILYFGESIKEATQTTSLIKFGEIKSFEDLKEELLKLNGKHIDLLIEDLYNLGRTPTIDIYFKLPGDETFKVEIKLLKRKNNYSIKVEPNNNNMEIKLLKRKNDYSRKYSIKVEPSNNNMEKIDPQVIKEMKKLRINFTIGKYTRVEAGQTIDKILNEFLVNFNI